MARARIGTSGWQYPDFQGRFYPESVRSAEQLAYYARRLDAVEVNRTFYSFSRASTYASWKERTRDAVEGFQVAVKAHRSFTHESDLRDPEGRLAEMFENISQLGLRLGPVLFQLPASFERDLRRLNAFLKILPSKGFRYVFELRHPSWHDPAAYRALEKKNAAFCIYDIRQKPSPVVTTADFAYVRLHGPHKTPYGGAYSREVLDGWVKQLGDWTRAGQDSYVFFDNTITGDAITDALYVREAIASESARIDSLSA